MTDRFSKLLWLSRRDLIAFSFSELLFRTVGFSEVSWLFMNELMTIDFPELL